MGGLPPHRFWKACDEVDHKDVTLHTNRNTCATKLLKSDIDIHKVSKWLGRSSVLVTEQLYDHTASNDLTIDPELLEAFHEGDTPAPLADTDQLDNGSR